MNIKKGKHTLVNFYKTFLYLFCFHKSFNVCYQKQVALGLSIAVSFISAMTIIAFPTQTYKYGMIIMWYPVATCSSKLIACIYYIPLVHRLKLLSIYEVCFLLEIQKYKTSKLVYLEMYKIKVIKYLNRLVLSVLFIK